MCSKTFSRPTHILQFWLGPRVSRMCTCIYECTRMIHKAIWIAVIPIFSNAETRRLALTVRSKKRYNKRQAAYKSWCSEQKVGRVPTRSGGTSPYSNLSAKYYFASHRLLCAHHAYFVPHASRSFFLVCKGVRTMDGRLALKICDVSNGGKELQGCNCPH